GNPTELSVPSELNELNKLNQRLLLIGPVGYLDFLLLTRNAGKVLTDSGGLQKEAYFAKVPCITLDDATGWPETVDDGWNTLVGSDRARIIDAVRHFEPQGEQRRLFGNGHAAESIVDLLASRTYNRHQYREKRP
ncbi:MAG: UDP-N-acetylglucosamine 2-epimerase, partial [Chloroflexota bacterium]